ncbi:MAG: hypothetical protein AB7S77_24740, partial [Desulfatirhabdiaceae bacterium]
MKLPELSLEPFFEKISGLTVTHRILICVAAYLLPVLAWGYFNAYPQYVHIQELGEEAAKLEIEVETARGLARQYNRFRKEMAEAEDEFRVARAALPDNQE